VNCTEAYDAILEADAAVLRGEGAGDLARHLTKCAVCRERARWVLNGLGALDRALEAEAGTARAGRMLRARPSVARRLAPWGLVAAAAAAVLILVRPTGAPRPPDLTALARSTVGIDVDISASTRPVAVLRTADPNITVVWFF
jgi:hypothetical protein